MSLKKKKGSSLIAVLMIFAVLSISGLSILSLTVSDYNLRVTASKKTQSLYASDSGINVVYGITQKVIEQAILVGNVEAKKYMDGFNKDASTTINPESGPYREVYSIEGAVNANLLKIKLNRTFQIAYKAYISSYINSTSEYIKNGEYLEYNKDTDLNKVIPYDTSNATKSNITATTITVPGNTEINITKPDITDANNKWKLNITSQFSTNPLNGQTSNNKTVTADIIISVPNYQESYSVGTNKQEITNNRVWQNAICIDGDMNINSGMTVTGDIFVKGNKPMDTAVANDKLYVKYNGGISIGSDDVNNPKKVIFNDNVVTSNSFNISGQGKKVTVLGNIYAGNVYIGKSNGSTSTQEASGCTLTVGTYDGKSKSFTNAEGGMVYTNNDLSLSALASNLYISKYYGINDVSGKRATGVDKDYNSSSSIIVNSDDIGILNGSNITIGEAIINGTAYINTVGANGAYQTGESVSIKGNYSAYTIPYYKIPLISKPTGISDQESNDIDQKNKAIEEKNKHPEGNVEFSYYDPMQLVKKIIDSSTGAMKDLTVPDKVSYFAAIDASNLATLKKSGITISNLTFSAGMSLNDQNQFVTTGADNSGEVTTKQNEFAGMVYEMGNESTEGRLLAVDYVNDMVNKDVFAGTGSVPQVTLSGIAESLPPNDTDSEVEVRTNKDVILLGSGVKPPTVDADKAIIVNLSTRSNPRGIIITSGNVTLSGAVNFTGTILAGKNLTANDDGEKTITYDANYVMKTIAKNYTNIYSKVFKSITGVSPHAVEVAAAVGQNANGTSTAIDGGLVKLSNWRVNN